MAAPVLSVRLVARAKSELCFAPPATFPLTTSQIGRFQREVQYFRQILDDGVFANAAHRSWRLLPILPSWRSVCAYYTLALPPT